MQKILGIVAAARAKYGIFGGGIHMPSAVPNPNSTTVSSHSGGMALFSG